MFTVIDTLHHMLLLSYLYTSPLVLYLRNLALDQVYGSVDAIIKKVSHVVTEIISYETE